MTPIDTAQLEKLRVLIGALLDGNPFYSAKLRAAGVQSPPATLADFSTGVPFTLKREIAADQLRHPPFGSNLTYPVERYTRFCQTSGTTGTPLRWLDTTESWEWMLDCWARIYEAAGAAAHDRIFFPFSFGPFLGFWLAFEAAVRLGCLAIPGGGMRSAGRLQAILDNEVTVLCATPSYALRLAEVADEEGIDLSNSKVRRIIVAGEPGGSIPATRDLIERRWFGARVLDHHGMTEIGPVSYECPERRGVLHIIEHQYFPEVIDPDSLAAVGAGGIGELVLTNLGRLGSPLLRYRTGDIVRPACGLTCVCGSQELALEGGILGRADDMVVVRGVNLYPSALEEVVRSAGGVAEFRVETYTERGLTEIAIQVEPAADHPPGLDSRISTALQTAFGLRVSVKCVPAGTLPRFETKARRWIQS